MSRPLTILLAFTLLQASVNAQENRSQQAGRSEPIATVMKKQIIQLKEGVLLVRLQTKGNAVTALREAGNNELADKINETQKTYNKEVIAAFKMNFTFCPVYFFYSNFSDSILSGHIQGIIFLDDSLQPNPAIKMNGEKFLTAEIGIIAEDTAKYFSYEYSYAGENGHEKRNAYYGDSNMRFEALIIMSDQLVQLKKPFPYYVRTDNSLPVKKKLSKAVKKMNKKLISYYEENKGN